MVEITLGDVVINLTRGLVLKGNVPVVLPNRDHSLLLYLAANAGRVISKEELLKNVWGNRIVEDSAIARTISQLRTALGENARDAIKTLPKRGYVLVPSDMAAISPSESPPGRLVSEPPQSPKGKKKVVALAIALVALVAVLVFAGYLLKPNTQAPAVRLSIVADSRLTESIIGSQLQYVAQTLQPSLRLEPLGRSRSGEDTLVAHITSQSQGLEALLSFQGRSYRASLGRGAQSSLYVLQHALAEIFSRDAAKLHFTYVATGPGVAQFDLDFAKTSSKLADAFATNPNNSAIAAELAFALNEQGWPAWPEILARDALTTGSGLSPDHQCLAAFVIADQLTVDKMIGEPWCALAQARLAEAKFDPERALALATQQSPSSVLISLKRMELLSRLTTAQDPRKEALSAAEHSIAFASQLGWLQGQARMQEALGDGLFGANWRAQAISAYRDAELTYRAIRDQIGEQRVRVSRMSLEKQDFERLGEEAEKLIELAEQAEDENSLILGQLTRLRFAPLTDVEYVDLLSKLISLINREKRFPSAVLERYLFALEASPRADLAGPAYDAMLAHTVTYPRLYLRVLTSQAVDLTDSGRITEALRRFYELDKQREKFESFNLLQTSFCVAAFAAIEGKDFAQAESWAKLCKELNIPKDIGCIKLFGDMALERTAWLRGDPQSNLATIIQRAAQGTPADRNCITVHLHAAALALRRQDLSSFQRASIYLPPSQGNIESIHADRILLKADICLAGLKSCDAASLNPEAAGQSVPPLDKARLHAKRILYSKACTKPNLDLAQTYEREAETLGAKLLAEQLRCAIASCNGPITADQCLGSSFKCNIQLPGRVLRWDENTII